MKFRSFNFVKFDNGRVIMGEKRYMSNEMMTKICFKILQKKNSGRAEMERNRGWLIILGDGYVS